MRLKNAFFSTRIQGFLKAENILVVSGRFVLYSTGENMKIEKTPKSPKGFFRHKGII